MSLLDLNPRTGAARRADPVKFRAPTAEDGIAVQALIASCNSLDDNSLYCNLLQCSHFADTCRLAERDGEIVGWVSAYLTPNDPDTLFIWQVAVSAAARGQGIAKRIIRDLLQAPACRKVQRIRTTITPENDASWALFESVAGGLRARLSRDAWFKRDVHFGGAHPTEYLVEIGPFGSAAKAA